MTVADDRVIEVALDEVLGGFVVEDLSEQILAATRESRVTRGPRHRPQARRARQARRLAETTAARRPRVSPSVLVAAAAVLVTAVIAFVLHGDGQVVIATSDTAMTVWRGTEELTTEQFLAGDCAYAADANVQLTLTGGALLGLHKESVVLLASTDRVELLRGQLTLDSHSKPPVVTAPNRVVVTPSTETSLRLVLATWPAGTSLRKAVATMIEKKTVVATTLALTVLAGQADVLSAQGGRVVRAGSTVELGGPVKKPKVELTAKQQKFIQRCITTLRSAKPIDQLGEEEAMMQMKDVAEASGDLVTLLRERPEAIALMRKDLLQIELPTTQKGSQLREAVLDILVLDEDQGVTRRVLRLLKQNPGWFSMRQLLSLAGRNQEPAITRIETIVKARPDDITLVPYASVLAMHKNRAGEKILRDYFARVRRIGVDDRAFMAAIGLHALGDQDAWSKQVARVKRKVDTVLSRDQLAQAKFVVLRAAYYHQAVATGKPIPIRGGVLDPLQRQYSTGYERLKTVADVMAELEKL